jgi:predicted amidohydrolase
MLICYDLEFPQWTRVAALAAADLLCVPTSWPASSLSPGESPIEVARARGLHRWTGSSSRCERAGAERGMDWVGGSAIIGPHGYSWPWPKSVAGRRGCSRDATCPRRGTNQPRRSTMWSPAARPSSTPASFIS